MRRLLGSIILASALSGGGCALDARNGPAEAASRGDAARCIALSARLGQDLRSHESEHFVLLTSADEAAATAIAQVFDQIHQRFYETFAGAGFAPKPLAEKLVCVSFDSYGVLNAYGRQADGVETSWMGAYYSLRTNRVAVVQSAGAGVQPAPHGSTASSPTIAALGDAERQAGGGRLALRTITHELAHQLAFNSGLQNRCVTNPFWVTEGLATNFEADAAGSFGLNVGQVRHRDRLVQAHAGGRLIPLVQFVGMSELPAGGGQTSADAYAQAWGLFSYLLQNRRRELVRFLADQAKGWPGARSGESLRRSFVGAFGPIEPLESDFLRFIKDLAGTTGAARH